MAATLNGTTGPPVSVQVAVASLDTTEAFYAGILDIPIMRALTVAGAPGHLILEREGWQLIFVEEDDVVRNHPVLEEELRETPKGVGVSLHVQVAAIEEIYDAVMEEELEVVYPLRTQPYGIKEFWCRDPDGYLVAVEETVGGG